jgi:hypothetical protein
MLFINRDDLCPGEVRFAMRIDGRGGPRNQRKNELRADIWLRSEFRHSGAAQMLS